MSCVQEHRGSPGHAQFGKHPLSKEALWTKRHTSANILHIITSISSVQRCKCDSFLFSAQKMGNHSRSNAMQSCEHSVQVLRLPHRAHQSKKAHAFFFELRLMQGVASWQVLHRMTESHQYSRSPTLASLDTCSVNLVAQDCLAQVPKLAITQ